MKKILEKAKKKNYLEIDILESLLIKYHNKIYFQLFEAANKLLPYRKESNHHIDLKGKIPLRHAPLYRMFEEELALVKNYIYKNLQKGFIIVSLVPWFSPVLFVKKPEGRLHFYINYRKLNAITKKNRYLIPLIKETLAQIFDFKIITKLDIRHAFNQIRLKTDVDKDFITFVTKFGMFKYKILPFDLCNSLATFQHYINKVLWKFFSVCI